MRYINLIPIEFGEKGMLLYRFGEWAELSSSTFHARGWRYTYPGGSPAAVDLPLAEPITVQAGDMPDALVPFLTQRLATVLEVYGTVEFEADTLMLRIGNSGRAYQLQIMYDAERMKFSILITPPHPDEVVDLRYLRFDFAKLQGCCLLEEDARLGDLKHDEISELSPNALYFSPDGYQSTGSGVANAREGIHLFGPMSRDRFANQQVQLIAVMDAGSMERGGAFMQDFLTGMQTSPEARRVWGNPFAKTFHIGEVQGKIIERDHVTDAANLQRILREYKGNGECQQLIFYISKQADVPLEAWAMRLGLPVVWIDAQLPTCRDKARAEALFDLGLRAYAKLGGIPWLIVPDRQSGHEVTIGVGSFVSEVDGTQMGFATVFTSQGFYRVGRADWREADVPWAKVLADFLLPQLRAIAQKDGWQQRDILKIRFHLDRDQSPDDIQALIASVKNELGSEYMMTFTVLTLLESHPFQLWDTEKEGYRLAGVQMAKYAANRGTYARVGRDACLLQLKRGDQASSRPLLIKFTSTGTAGDNLHYHVEQVHHFSFLSWYSSQPADLPVTLEYGQRIVRKCSALAQIDPGFVVPQNLQDVPWFL